MAITDVRAYTYCNLGKVIRAQIQDSGVQGAGLIKVAGTVDIEGIIHPQVKQKVEFAITIGTRISKLPRRLLVLSYACDPNKNITTVQLGDDFTYFSGREANDVKLLAKDSPGYTDIPCADRLSKFVPPAMSAQWIAEQCLNYLNINGSITPELENEFQAESFELSSGYSNVLDGLIHSESLIGFLTPTGNIKTKSAQLQTDSGVALNERDMITFEPISSGTLPSEKLLIRYQTKKLKDNFNDDDADRQSGEFDSTLFVGEAVDTYEDDNGNSVTEFIQFQGADVTRTDYDEKGRVTNRTNYKNTAFGRIYTNTNITYNNSSSVSGVTDQCGIPVYSANENNTLISFGSGDTGGDPDSPKAEYTTITEPALSLGRRCGYKGRGLNFERRMISEQRTIIYNKRGDITFVTEYVQIPYYETVQGSIAIDAWMQQLEAEGFTGFQEQVYNKAKSLDVRISSRKIRTEKEFGVQRVPRFDETAYAVNSLASSDSGDAESEQDPTADSKNGVEEEEEVDYEYGSAGAGTNTVAEYSPPYTSDDIVTYDVNADLFSLKQSNAKEKSKLYAKIQNEINYGYRNGITIELPYAKAPSEPYSTVYISLNNTTAAYKANNISYRIDENGVVVSLDAILIGTVGVTGMANQSFVPLPTGVTVGMLPAAPTAVTATPVIVNSIDAPNGFDYLNPDLSDLFDNLLANVDNPPVYESTINNAIPLPPYTITEKVILGVDIGLIVYEYNYSLEPTVVAIDPLEVNAELYMVTNIQDFSIINFDFAIQSGIEIINDTPAKVVIPGPVEFNIITNELAVFTDGINIGETIFELSTNVPEVSNSGIEPATVNFQLTTESPTITPP